MELTTSRVAGREAPTLGGLVRAGLLELGALAKDGFDRWLASRPVAALPMLSGVLVECPLGGSENHAPNGAVAIRAATEDDFATLAWLDDATPERAWAWEQSSAFAGEWLAADEVTRDRLPEAWLELDREGPVRAPSLFARLGAGLGRPARLGPHVASTERRCLVAVTMLARWAGIALDVDERSALRRVLHHMPASASLSYIGVMAGRGGGIRVTLDDMPLDACTHFFRAMGWAGGEGPIVELQRFLGEYAERVVLHVDLDGAGLGPRVGMEILPDAARRRELLRALVERGLALREAVEAVEAWPLQRHRVGDPASWPPSLADRTYLVRSVNHLKLALRTEGARPTLEAKAYLALSTTNVFPTPRLWSR